MRITYLYQYFVTPREPGMTRAYEMARRLVAAGHEVNMISSRRGSASSGINSNVATEKAGSTWEVTNEDGIVLHRIPVPYSNYMSYKDRTVSFFRYAIHAARRAASLDADVIYASSGPLTIALPAIYAKHKRRTPMVLEARDLWPRGAIAIGALKHKVPITMARWLEKAAYDNSTRIVALAPSIKAGIEQRGVPTERIHVIPNSSDVALFRVPEEQGLAYRAQYDWLQHRPMVLYAGTLGRVNGIEYLADIAAETLTVNPEIRFVVVGDGAMAPKVRARAIERGVLNRNFFMMGERPKAQMPPIFSAATISVSTVIDNPLLWGDSANKIFDAFAAGRPIAINHGGWQEEIIRETGVGVVLPATDSVAAARILAEKLCDVEFLTNASKAAHVLADTRFNRDLLAKELEQVLLLASAEGRR